jgi:four helix bundle protein
MNPKTVALQARTRRFASDTIKLCDELPATPAGRKLAEQLADSAGATDSNYRAACRARSKREFIAKIGVAIEEADESKGWLELLVAATLASETRCAPLIQEADELTRIFVSSRKTAQLHEHQREALERPPRRSR